MKASSVKIRAGLFLVSLSVILWEILLTRIYSVILYYHFAFMAVSVAMFGLTVGALIAYFKTDYSSSTELERGLGELAAVTGLLMAVTMAIQVTVVPPALGRYTELAYLLRTYVLSLLPFIPAGAFICLALTRFQDVGRLYMVDLLGAALGCLILPLALSCLGGPGAVVGTGALACAAGGLLLPRRSQGRAWALCLAAAMTVFSLVNSETHWLRVRWWHAGPITKPLYESWNAFSRIMVSPRGRPDKPFGWGMDPSLAGDSRFVEELFLIIDSGAGTLMTAFDGRLDPLVHLKKDLTSFAYHLRPGGRVMIMGPGGGRDILTALHFAPERIDAVEVNGNIVRAVNEVFGDFTGHLDRHPAIRFVVDEARSYLERSPDLFRVVQASLVDTVAATAAGAYAFTENGLYTVEAWRLFLNRLEPGGVLSFSRWYLGAAPRPVEIYRTVALAGAALRAEGISDPSRHILVVRTRQSGMHREGLATIVVSPQPFSPADLQRARAVCQSLRCDVAYSAAQSLDPHFNEILGDPMAATDGRYPLDISPPIDNRPYFFFHDRLQNVFRAQRGAGNSWFNTPAVRVLVASLVISVACAGLLLFAPLVWIKLRRSSETVSSPHAVLFSVYFSGIGLGFMFVEIALMQRLSLFLGHPTYGFTVALFGLLCWTGLGSWFLERWKQRVGEGRLVALFPVLAACLIGLEIFSREILIRASGSPVAWRIALTLAMLAPAGLLMGCCFPMGMRRVSLFKDPRAGWYWAVNGATSVIGAVLAMTLCFALGIQTTLWIGAALYAALGGVYYRLTGGLARKKSFV